MDKLKKTHTLCFCFIKKKNWKKFFFIVQKMRLPIEIVYIRNIYIHIYCTSNINGTEYEDEDEENKLYNYFIISEERNSWMWQRHTHVTRQHTKSIATTKKEEANAYDKTVFLFVCLHNWISKSLDQIRHFLFLHSFNEKANTFKSHFTIVELWVCFVFSSVGIFSSRISIQSTHTK